MSPGSASGNKSLIILSTMAAGTISQIARGFVSFCTNSLRDDAPIALSLASASTAFGETSKTTHSCPPLISRRTMFAPIRPSPIIPSCMARLLILLRPILLFDVPRVVPQSYDWLREIVIIAEYAEACGAQKKVLPRRGRQAKPACCEHAEKVAARKQQNVFSNLLRT